VNNYVEGYATREISVCPYCGDTSLTIKINGVCECEECGHEFAVVEIE